MKKETENRARSGQDTLSSGQLSCNLKQGQELVKEKLRSGQGDSTEEDRR